MCFVEQKTFSLILRIFLTNAPPCGSLCILVYKNADVDNFYSKSLRSMDHFFADLKVIIICLWNRKHFLWYYVYKCATFVVPFVFWYTKMLTLTICTQNRWGVWTKFFCRFNGYYNVFRGTENIFCDITYFPHKCATFVVPFVFWYTKMLTLTICTQNRWGVWLKFFADLKVIIICFVEQKTFSVILRIFLTNAPPLWFPLYFGIQKCWRWQFLLKVVEEYG